MPVTGRVSSTGATGSRGTDSPWPARSDRMERTDDEERIDRGEAAIGAMAAIASFVLSLRGVAITGIVSVWLVCGDIGSFSCNNMGFTVAEDTALGGRAPSGVAEGLRLSAARTSKAPSSAFSLPEESCELSHPSAEVFTAAFEVLDDFPASAKLTFDAVRRRARRLASRLVLERVRLGMSVILRCIVGCGS